jgi:hypothetical protein
VTKYSKPGNYFDKNSHDLTSSRTISVIHFKPKTVKPIPMFKYLPLILCCSLIMESGCIKEKTGDNDDKTQLIQLEHQWLEGEFIADTSFLSSIIDSTFICITQSGVLNKKEILKKMEVNKNFRTRNDIVIDSVRLENAVVNLYTNSAVVTFIDHTFARKQGEVIETRVQFYDVWIKRGDQWKAVSSQAHY